MTRTCPTHRFALTAALAALLGTGGLALAASPASAVLTLAQADTQAGEFSEAKLAAFAEAANEVSAIAREWGPQIRDAEQAGNSRKVRQLKKQADKEVRDAIQQAEGISMSEYTDIAEAARQDQGLYRRIMEKMNQAE